MAVVSDGASFVPSPTITTRRPRASSAATRATLASAVRSPSYCVIPTACAILATFSALSPENRYASLMPNAANSANIGASSSRSSSANSMRATDGTCPLSTPPWLSSVATYARNPDAPTSNAKSRAANDGTRSRTKSGDPTAT